MSTRPKDPGPHASVGRRTFNKAALAAGAALAATRTLPGCKGPAASGTETRTLHFDLSRHPSESTHELRALGKRHPLIAHTPESVKQAIAENSDLAGSAGKLTHYAAHVELRADKMHMFSVTSHHPTRGDGLALMGVHVPTHARAGARSSLRTAAAARSCAAAGSVDCEMADQVADDFVTAFDAAKAIVMHHPEIANLDPDIAAAVEAHICASAAVADLALSICNQGPAYTHDDAYKDGWCVLVPRQSADGSPMLDRTGKQVYDYQFSAQTSQDLKPAVKDVLSRIKNDPSLRDKQYAIHPHGSTDEGGASSLSARLRMWASAGAQVAATNTGYHHNVWFKPPTRTGPSSFHVDIVNMNFVWYGLYLEYLDGAGKVVSPNAPGSMLAGADGVVTKALGWLESDTVKWENVIASPPTVFGVPLVPYPTSLDVDLPDGACSARVMLCGPGAFGSVDFGPSLAVGVILTGLLQYALPAYFLYSGKGIAEDGSLWDVFSTKLMKLKIVAALAEGMKEVLNPTATHQAALVGSIESVLASMLENLIVVATNGSMPAISQWIAEETAEEEAEDAVPFVGWVIRIITLLGTVADMVATTAEIASNPMVIDNVLTRAASVGLTVSCDPEDYQFPEEATYFEVQFTLSGAAYPAAPQGFTLGQAERGQRTLTRTIDGVPTTGKTDSVDIWFYSDAQRTFLAGHGRADFVNKQADDGSVSAAVVIEENPIPVNASTVYGQHRKLEYRSGGYVWNEASPAAPVIQAPDCGSGLCELTDISVWVPGGMLGYSWMAGTQHVIKNVNAQESDPNPGMKVANTGAGAPTPVGYDKTAPYSAGNLNGRHFYLDPVSTAVANPAYYLRKLCLDPASGTFQATQSWGKFPMQLDRLAVHPFGYVVGLSTNDHKLGILKLPDAPYADDATTNNGVIKLGYGDTDWLLKRPQAMTVSRSGAILVLQGETSFAIKAFDVAGNPWKFFSGGTASSMPLDETDAKWLDIAIDDTELIFVLSFTGSGLVTTDYRLDVYDKDGKRLDRTVGVAVGRMVVDKWRRVYTLNQEVMTGSPLVEPTVSVWMPSVPSVK